MPDAECRMKNEDFAAHIFFILRFVFGILHFRRSGGERDGSGSCRISRVAL